MLHLTVEDCLLILAIVYCVNQISMSPTAKNTFNGVVAVLLLLAVIFL